jgi:hypothetical protein
VTPDSIPAELRSTPQWVLWKWRIKDAAWKKQPCDSAGVPASVTDKANYLSFDAAMELFMATTVDGIGFAFTKNDPYMGVDLDKCVGADGSIDAWAQEVIDTLNSYTEFSPSGTGVHVLCVGEAPKGGNRRGKVEFYDWGRFFCVTGRLVPGAPAEMREAQPELDIVHAKHVAKPIKTAKIQQITMPGTTLSDTDLLNRMFAAKNKEKTQRLWNGKSEDYGGDTSAADLALCFVLAFWSNRDADQMDRLFRQSGRMRDKWDEGARTDETYGQGTIREAIESCHEVYQAPKEKAVSPKQAAAADEEEKRPQVVISTDEGRTIDHAIMALQGDETLYMRGRRLVTAGCDETEGGVLKRDGGLCIVSIQPGNLRERLARSARVMKWASKGGDFSLEPTHPPEWLVNSLFQRGIWPGIRYLRAIVNHPVMVAGGRILNASGYDATTGLLVNTNLSLPVPEKPTEDEILQARNDLLDVITDFEFPEPRAQYMAAWLSALLTLFARPAIDGPCPLFLMDKSVRGAGGSLLADCVSGIALGGSLPRMSEATEVDEQRKRITAILLAGDEAVLIDNVEHSLGGSALDALLTSTSWRDRMLGSTQMTAVIPALTVWFATGNNVQVKGDTVRRVLPVRIEPNSERPETRGGFRYPNLLAEVKRNRARLATCVLTILRGYVAAGAPDMNLPPWGSFEAWSRVVRHTLVWMGLPDPVTTRAELLTTADRERSSIAVLFEAMDAAPLLACGTFTAAKVAEQAKSVRELKDALDEMGCVERDAVNVKLLAWEFRRAKGRIVVGKRLELVAGNNHGNVWRLVSVKGV